MLLYCRRVPAPASCRICDASTTRTSWAASHSMAGAGIAWPASGGTSSTTMAILESAGVTREALLDRRVAPNPAGLLKSWRKTYSQWFIQHVRASAASNQAALKLAAGGLAQVYERFTFERAGAPSMTLAAACSALLERTFPLGQQFEAAVITSGRAGAGPFELPAWNDGHISQPALRGAEAVECAREWVRRGVIEPSCLRAIEQASSGQHSEALANHTFVVMGAVSAMGPFTTLLALGATVVAVDLNKPVVQARLIACARGLPGRLVLPYRSPDGIGVTSGLPDDTIAASAGCDLLRDAPEIASFLAGLLPENNMTIGAYCYMDGAKFVSIALAQDLIMATVPGLRRGCKGSRVSLAYLCSPTDIFARTKECRQDVERRYRDRPVWMRAAGAVGLLPLNAVDKEPITSHEGATLDLVQCVIGPQGPNYLLAKRIQHWRALTYHQLDGAIVSTNIAPASATESVKKVWVLSKAYQSMPSFEPMVVFPPEMSQAVMTAALLHDVFDTDSAAHRDGGGSDLRHPLELFSYNAWHGGMWRCPVEVPSSAVLSILMSVVDDHKGKLAVGTALTATIGSKLLSRL